MSRVWKEEDGKKLRRKICKDADKWRGFVIGRAHKSRAVEGRTQANTSEHKMQCTGMQNHMECIWEGYVLGQMRPPTSDPSCCQFGAVGSNLPNE
jgi:hypothetical protein